MDNFAKYSGILLESIPLILVLMIIKYYFDKKRLFLLGNRLPGPRPWPLIGNALEFVEKDLGKSTIKYLKFATNLTFFYLLFLLDYMNKITEFNKRYGLTACWIGHKLHVYISKPEEAEIYFTSHHLLNKNENYEFVEALLGKGLVTANGLLGILQKI